MGGGGRLSFWALREEEALVSKGQRGEATAVAAEAASTFSRSAGEADIAAPGRMSDGRWDPASQAEFPLFSALSGALGATSTF